MLDVEVSADMKSGREELSEDIMNLLRYSAEDYRPFVLRTVVNEDSEHNLSNITITSQEVSRLIKGIDSKKATCPDKIQVVVLKNINS